MPRRPQNSDPPRLVLRFAVSICIALALAAAAILLVVRHFDTVQAERAATSEARVIASSVLRGSLARVRLRTRPVRASRRASSTSSSSTTCSREGVLLVKLYATNGSSPTAPTTGCRHRDTDTRAHREALGGTVRGDVTSLSGEKTLRTYAPVSVPRRDRCRRALPGLRADRAVRRSPPSCRSPASSKSCSSSSS